MPERTPPRSQAVTDATPPEGPLRLFVYGTLRRGSASLMAERLVSSATFVGDATVPGTLYDTGNYPACVPSLRPEDRVHGEVFALHPETAGALLAELDQYEGFAADSRYASLFVREVTTARFADGSEQPVWIYHYNEKLDDTTPITTGDWLARGS
jgi:gamma-glutamylcyclotransferase (GGCT)/AIG2-like uncharacterized protein YtfP